MSQTFSLEISDALICDLLKITSNSSNTLSDVVRKALTLFVIAYDAQASGMAVAFVDVETNALQTKIVGL